MQKYLQYLFFLCMAACITACGNSNSATTSSTPIYDSPLPYTLAAPSLHMGGAVQGGAISTKFSNYSTSTTSGVVGTSGFADTSPTVKAIFNHPTDITFDNIRNIFYVTDYGNNAIRKITPDGDVTTLQCVTADVIPIPIGFNRPTGITTDGINIYVVDSGSNTIRFIEIDTLRVTTIIGSTTGLAGSVDSKDDKTAVRFNLPIGITTDGENLYVTDYNNSTVRRIVIATGAVSTLAGTSGAVGSSDGSQDAARFNHPGRITTDGINLFLTDFGNRTIRKIGIKNADVTTVAGAPGPLSADGGTTDATGTAARFNQPNGITTDGTNLYVTDSYKNTIRKVVISSGVVTTISGVAGTFGYADTLDGAPTFNTPVGITTGRAGIFVVDSNNNTIRKIK